MTYTGTPHRNLLFHGLRLTLRRFPALLWAFLFNLLFAAITASRISGAIGKITDSSLAAQPLRHGFDLSTVADLYLKMSQGTGLSLSFAPSTLLYFFTYFLLVPGTLLCYQTGIPARLSTLLQAGLLHFWRFVRITLLTLLVMALILGPLGVAYSKYSDYLDDHVLGKPGFFASLAGVLFLSLVAAILRLYFDLVEVYTVQLGLNMRANGKPDRRVRKALGPAFRALGRHFFSAYFLFVLLSALGFACVFVTGRIAVHSLAQAHVLHLFLLSQTGLFLLMFTRFWQRGMETTLSLNHPILEAPIIRTTFAPREPRLQLTPEPATTYVPPPPVHTAPEPIADPIPATEPATPSLATPDPAIYRPEPNDPHPHHPNPDEV